MSVVNLSPVTVSALQTAINNTSVSVIVIPTGTYTLTGFITISRNNLTIEASGNVIFTGGNLSFGIIGNNCILRNLQFVNTSAFMGILKKPAKVLFSANDLISISGNSNTITGVNINSVYAYHIIYVDGISQNTVISYINIENKLIDANNLTGTALLNSMVQLVGNPNNDPTFANNARIHHCSFQNMRGNGGKDIGADFGCEPIRIGNSSSSTCNLSTIVEYCVFNNVGLADNETISIKSMNNVIRYNTFSNNSFGYVSFRNGNNNIAYGNFHINSAGVRFKQASNCSVYNSYFENCTRPCEWINLSTLGYPDYKTLYKQNINVQNNTFYNCTPVSLDLYDLSQNTFANNILVADANDKFVSDLSSVSIFDSSHNRMLISGNLGPIFDSCGNILSMPCSIGDINGFNVSGNMCYGGIINVTDPVTGFIYIDPLLQQNTANYSSITSTSPSIGQAINPNSPLLSIPGIDTDASLNLDITGATRVLNSMGNNDIGCNQNATTGTPTNKPLTVNMVGPIYLRT